MSELIAIAVTYHIDVIKVQEHRFYHEDIDLKYHELGNGWNSYLHQLRRTQVIVQLVE